MKKIGSDRTVSVLENSMRDGVKEGGVGGLQKGASEELGAGVDIIILIQQPCLNTKNQYTQQVALF